MLRVGVMVSGGGTNLQAIFDALDAGKITNAEIVVVISNNRANKYSTVITVVPLSSHISKKRNLPTHVFVSAYRCSGLSMHSLALCEQVMSVDKLQVIDYIGRMDAGTLEQVTRAVQIQIDA